jgi:simple sugar transport system ATP-binding protein
VTVAGDDLTGKSAHAFLEHGMGHIPEDRHRRGLVLEFSLAENLVLHDYAKAPYAKHGLLSPKRIVEAARGLLREFDVRGGTPQTRASALSGGNQQKVVVAREVSRDPKVLLAAQPTRGLDIGAVGAVYDRIRQARDVGVGVLLISSELDELIAVADRILVIFRGRIIGDQPADPSAREAIGRLMAGEFSGEPAA